LVLAGKFVLISGKLLVAGILMVPPIVPAVLPILELVAELSVEPLGVFWLQPANANAARKVIADKVIFDFISSLFYV
jgi:hypothetical protein